MQIYVCIFYLFQLDLDDLTVENAIAKKFHKQLQVQLDPIWHQLGSSTKQLVADLKLLGYFLTLVKNKSIYRIID